MGNLSPKKITNSWIYRTWFIYQLENNKFYIFNPLDVRYSRDVEHFKEAQNLIDEYWKGS